MCVCVVSITNHKQRLINRPLLLLLQIVLLSLRFNKLHTVSFFYRLNTLYFRPIAFFLKKKQSMEIQFRKIKDFTCIDLFGPPRDNNYITKKEQRSPVSLFRDCRYRHDDFFNFQSFSAQIKGVYLRTIPLLQSSISQTKFAIII